MKGEGVGHMALEEQLADFLRNKIKVGKATPQKFPIAFPMYKIKSKPDEIPSTYPVYLCVGDKKEFYLSDEGATIAELDQIFELKEPDVIKNLVAILRQYGCRKQGNNMVIECTPQNIHIQLSYLLQAISFMLNMKIFYV
ncbi:MAG: DUF1828 domain-containing protein [Christensenellaceae bacterium]|nr:DUF1828 domain-containing protein [Christensenellaceae bacterium]